jgi:hypothetical protein
VATIIDSLVVELGLDTKKLDEGQREAVAKLRQLESATQAHIKPVEAGFNQLIGTFKDFQGRLLGITALIAGGLGLDRLVGDLAKVNAQTGYLAKSLGQTNEELTRLQAAAMLMGQTKEDATSAAVSIANSYADFSLGKGGPLQRIAGSFPGLNRDLDALKRQYGSNAPTSEVMLALSRFATQEEKDPNRARRIMQDVGLSQGAINMALQGPDAIKKAYQEAGPFAVTAEQLKNLQALNIEFNKLMLAVERLTRAIASNPDLIKFLDSLTKIVDAFYNKGGAGGAATLESEASKGTGAFFGDLWGGTKRWIQRNNPFGGGASTPGDQPSTPKAPGTSSEGGPATFDERFKGDGGGGTGPINRSGFRSQLTPEMTERLATIVQGEVGHKASRDRQLVQLETIFNRATARGQSLEEVTRMYTGPGSKGYYPPSTFSGGRVQSKEELDNFVANVLNPVLSGSDRSTELMGFPATGNASGGVAARGILSGRYTKHGMVGPETYVQEGHFPGENIARLEAARRETATASLPSFLPSGSGAAGRLFDQWRGLDTLSRPRFAPGGSTTNNSSSSQTSIGTMNVSVPQGANPGDYADGIREHLERVAPVYHSLTGMN